MFIFFSVSSGNLLVRGVCRRRTQTLTLCFLESRLGSPCAVSARGDEEYPRPSLRGRKSMSHNPRAAKVLAAPLLGEWNQIYLCPTPPPPSDSHSLLTIGKGCLGISDPSSRALRQRGWGSVMESWWGRSEERLLFLEFVLLPQNSFSNSSGDRESTLDKSSLDRHISDLIWSPPGGNLVHLLLFAASIS